MRDSATALPAVKGLVGGLLQVVLYGLALIVPAGLVTGGTWHWTRALAFLGLYAVALAMFVLVLGTVAPASLRARLSAPTSKDQPSADRLATVFLVLATLAWFVFVPIDVFELRLLPPPPFAVSIVGAGICLGGFVIIMTAIHQNSFAIPIVEDQRGRAQQLVDRGLYGRVRHPMYSGILLFHAGLALWLQSYASLGALTVILAALIVRIVVEEAMLRTTLGGYTAYAARVPFRLVPLVW